MTYLYFFSTRGRIKIGISQDVTKRLRSVGAHMAKKPLLIGFMEGSFALEKHVHTLLSKHRLRGEWFRDCPEVRKLIESLITHGPDALGFREPPPSVSPPWVPPSISPEDRLITLNKLITLLWPDNPVASFADFCEAPEETCREWLSGERRIPNVVAHALSAAVVISMFGASPASETA